MYYNSNLKLSYEKQNLDNEILDYIENIIDGKSGEEFWRYEDRILELNRISQTFNFESFDISSEFELKKILNLKKKLEKLEKKIEKKYDKNKIKTNDNSKLGIATNHFFDLKKFKTNISNILNYNELNISKNVKNIIDILDKGDINYWRYEDRINKVKNELDQIKIDGSIDDINSLNILNSHMNLFQEDKYKNYSNDFKDIKNSIKDILNQNSMIYGLDSDYFKIGKLNQIQIDKKVFLDEKVIDFRNKYFASELESRIFLSKHFEIINKSDLKNDQVYKKKFRVYYY